VAVVAMPSTTFGEDRTPAKLLAVFATGASAGRFVV
jgi:hypothetical protein